MPEQPMWRQIAEDLRQKIESGALGRDNRPLPSELELREEYQASRNTVRDAVKWLITRGLIVTKPGQGTFVVKDIDPFVTELSTAVDAVPGGESTTYASEVLASRRTSDVSEPRVEVQRAGAVELAVAAELDLPEGSNVVSRHQERFIDGTPWSLQTSFYPFDLVQRGALRLIQAETILPGATPYIEEALDIKRTGRRDRFTVRAPDRKETEFFDLPDDGRVAVIEITQTIYYGEQGESGKPLAVTVTTYPADRNQFVMTTGTAPAATERARSRPAEPNKSSESR